MAPMLLVNDDNTHQETAAFSTPPATWNSRRSPMRVMMPNSVRAPPPCKRDLFHVVNKVPAGNSPYVKAKHVQLIEKDPSKAISLFWAAINAGDRVDSALKDMAVVMKQLDRSDEAIEAIKSFRHRCPYDSQESLDNVLLELYKRSGRIDEEIWMLECKLKNIEDGRAFGGRRTKFARSQGKKVQVTIDQERARLLGNLAWAYLQQHNYGFAEQHYRKALSLEPDRNKQCNLAICLTHMNRISEAKSLLQNVRASLGSRQMDESCAKSFERASQILASFESQAGIHTTEELQRSVGVPCSGKENHDGASRSTDASVWTGGSHRKNFSESQGKAFEQSCCASEYSPYGLRGSSVFSPLTALENGRKQGFCYDSPSEQLGSSKMLNERGSGLNEKDASSLHERPIASPSPVLFTQPRCSWWSSNQRRARSRENTAVRATPHNPNSELLGSTNDNLEAMMQKPQYTSRGWRGSRTEELEVKDNAVAELLSVPEVEEHRTQTSSEHYGYANEKGEEIRDYGETVLCRAYTMEASNSGVQYGEARASGASVNAECNWNSEVIIFGSLTTPNSAADMGDKTSKKHASKCWADMVEEDDEEEFNNENLNSGTMINQNSGQVIDGISQKLEAIDVKRDGSLNAVSKNSKVRRSLCFEPQNYTDTKWRNRRLQVFKDITTSVDNSP